MAGTFLLLGAVTGLAAGNYFYKRQDLCELLEYYRASRNPEKMEVCTMCGDFCAMKIVSEYMVEDPGRC